MVLSKFKDFALPSLGLGCMRLPMIAGGEIDKAEFGKMVAYAISNGANYFDTGYDYHGGMSEKLLGEILSNYPRDRFYVADKFPGYNPMHWRKVEKIFNEQLERCQLDYFDFYLFHNVSELSIDAYLNPRYGIFDYLQKQKENGKIKYLGFSVHGNSETTARFLEAFGKHMDFAQIQLNYIDYEFQHANEKLALLEKYAIPVFVMEPLRGGKLCAPAKGFEKRYKDAFGERDTRELAFSFVRSFDAVKLTLSGMSNLSQLKENINLFSQPNALTGSEKAELIRIAKDVTAVGTVPCTSCSYCTEHCPMGLDIPKLMGYYNEHTFSGGGFIVPAAISSLDRSKRPTACIHCKKCETFCPQNIKVSEILAELCEKLNGKK